MNTPTTAPSAWVYDWNTDSEGRMILVTRSRREPTLDGFDRPFAQIVGYCLHNEKGWFRYRHDSKVAEPIEREPLAPEILMDLLANNIQNFEKAVR
jgi:hypothetical protein